MDRELRKNELEDKFGDWARQNPEEFRRMCEEKRAYKKKILSVVLKIRDMPNVPPSFPRDGSIREQFVFVEQKLRNIKNHIFTCQKYEDCKICEDHLPKVCESFSNDPHFQSRLPEMLARKEALIASAKKKINDPSEMQENCLNDMARMNIHCDENSTNEDSAGCMELQE